MPQPLSFNTGTPVSGSIQENSISYVVDGQGRNYRGGYSGLAWMSEAPATNNVIFIGNSTSVGRGPANTPLFYPSLDNSEANIIYAANHLPGSPGNITSTASAYDYAIGSGFFINNSDNPIPRIDADGLVLYLSAFLPTSYPQVGTTWYDLSGYGNNATLYNGLDSNWDSNGWFSFDGVDDYAYINYDSNSMAAWTGSQTIIFWEYHDFNDGSRRNFWNQAYGGAGTWTHEGGYNINYYYGDSGVNNVPYTSLNSTSTPTGKWNMLTTTRDPSQVKWYINNTNTDSMSNPYGVLTLTTADITIGNGYTGTPWIGNIGAIAAYNKALTQAEINQVYFQSNIVTDGLVFMVDANNLVSYPKSGNRTYNLIGGTRGDLTNGTSFTVSNGGSFVFDGVDDYITFSNNTSLDSQTITMESWSNINSLFQNGFLFEKGQVNTQYSNFYNSDGTFYFRTMGLSAQDLTFYCPSYISPNTWNHIVCTYGAGIKTIYVNGVQIAQQTGLTGTISTNATGLFLGAYGPGTGYFLNGKIAQSRVYNKALSAGEVQQNYQETKYKFGL
jgi:hypothetical protein